MEYNEYSSDERTFSGSVLSGVEYCSQQQAILSQIYFIYANLNKFYIKNITYFFW